MNRPLDLYIIRHAESKRNVAKRGNTFFQDEADLEKVRGVPDHLVPLTRRGISQARQTGRALALQGHRFDYVYDSGYFRAVQTRNCILSAFPKAVVDKMQIRSNSFLRERDSGYTYDMTEEQVDKFFPWLKEYWKTHRSLFATPPGGESLIKVSERVELILNMVFERRVGESVAMVTHGRTGTMIRARLEHWSYSELESFLNGENGESPINCGVTHYRYSNKHKMLRLVSYNMKYWK